MELVAGNRRKQIAIGQRQCHRIPGKEVPRRIFPTGDEEATTVATHLFESLAHPCLAIPVVPRCDNPLGRIRTDYEHRSWKEGSLLGKRWRTCHPDCRTPGERAEPPVNF